MKKKFLATAMAAALAVGSLPMAALAADGGTIDVTVSTKTAVLRVEVPTSLVIAVDQFEMADAGVQIYSDDFDITNKSEVDVRVDVKSTATTTDITLKSAVADVESSTNADGDAWLAVAAQTSEGSYADGGVTGIADLTEENRNVAVFDTTEKTAAQTFYLAQGTGDAAYSLLAANDGDSDATNIKANAAEVTYAQFYALTAATITDDATLATALATSDVYAVVTADKANGAAVTKIEKGTTDSAYASMNTYYTAATTATTVDSLDYEKIYVYGGTGAAASSGGKAAFRYIGHLCDLKDTWTNTDISKVEIAYTIAGVKATKFEEVEEDCVYGLYVASNAAKVDGTSITNNSGSTVYSTGAALASRLKSGAVVFRFDTEANDISNLSVTKIVIDGVTYTADGTTTKFTAAATSGTENCDGYGYTLTGFSASTVSSVKVYYGDDTDDVIVVSYKFE